MTTPAGNAKNEEPTLKDVLTQVSTMLDTITALGKQVSAQGSALEELRARSSAGAQDTDTSKKDSGPKRLSVADLERMDRLEFANYLTDQIIHQVRSELVQPLQSTVANTATSAERERIQREINEMSAKYKDFKEWKEEILALSKDHPTLNLQRLYILARSEYPDKAKEMDKKFASTEESKPSPGESRNSFGGMSSGRNAPTVPKTNMQREEAAEAAWDAVMGNSKGVAADAGKTATG